MVLPIKQTMKLMRDYKMEMIIKGYSKEQMIMMKK